MANQELMKRSSIPEQRQTADIDAEQIRLKERQNIITRADQAARQAHMIMTATGLQWNQNKLNSVEQVTSSQIGLGQLPTSEELSPVYGFACISLSYDLKREQVTKRIFPFVKITDFEHKRGELRGINIDFFAGAQDGQDAEEFMAISWNRDTDTGDQASITAIEEGLCTILLALQDPELPETGWKAAANSDLI